jgi:diadenosine tetraphosphatase ApaH/serine/threonine PP2A family protein phosphatase
MIIFEDRLSDSPFIERVWRSHSGRPGTFRSIAASTFEMVVSRHGGRTFFTLRGPESQATLAELPADGEWFAVRFRLGTFVPHLTPGNLTDRRDVTLPEATRHSFWLNGSAWDYPDFENAETFVNRLFRKGILVRDPTVDAVIAGGTNPPPARTLQRHFLRATGLTFSAVRQIERARYATILLREGMPILDVVQQAGYYDQAHLTRSLRHRIGQTPTAIIRRDEQLSFLYKTPWAR